MPRGGPPAWSVKDCRFDYIVNAVLLAGHGVPLTMTGIDTPERAAEIRRGIYRCGQHRKVSVRVSWLYRGQDTTITRHWPPDKVKGSYQLTITAWRKAHGRRHVVDTYGPDRRNWHYNPRQRQQKES